MLGQQQAFDPYRVLGVPRSADGATIKAAHRKRAKETHPDAGGDRRQFEAVTRAVAILADPIKRKRYDETGDADEVNPNNTDAHAWQLIGQVLQQMLSGDQEPPMTADLVETIRRALGNSINQIKVQQSVLDRIQKRAKRLAKRFKKRTRAQQNMIRLMVENQARGAAATRARAAEAIRHHERALELLKDYDFERDEPPPMPSFADCYTSTSTWGG